MKAILRGRIERVTINIPLPAGLLKSWKTTLTGAASLTLGIISASSYHGDWVAALHDRGIQLAIAIAVLGFVSKDGNVTGGTSGQPSTPQALADANVHPSDLNKPTGPPAVVVKPPTGATA